MESTVQQRGQVTFPAFTGERVYMHEFTKSAGLPNNLKRWQDTVDQMLDGVDADGPIYLMIDQAAVKAGLTHRRPGLHVDGYWNPGGFDHGRNPPGHGGHRGVSMHGHRSIGGADELLILATNELGCRAFVGSYELPQDFNGGDCSSVETSGMLSVPMDAGWAWAGDTRTMLHESIAHQRDCLRTVVRLNVPIRIPKTLE
jgi:hypothetical protein